MSFYIFKPVKAKTVFKLFLCILTSIILFSTSTINSIAEGDNTNSTVITHTHHGDAANGGSCYQTPVYHTHTHSGNSSSGGGCYTGSYTAYSYHTHTYSCPTSTSSTCNHIYGYGEGYGGSNACPECGHTHVGAPCQSHSCTSIDYHCGYTPNSGPYTVYYIDCGRTEGVQYEDEGIDSYVLSCEFHAGGYGTLSITNSTPEWTSGNVSLAGSLSGADDKLTSGGYGEMTFSSVTGTIVSTTGNTAVVSENGIYALNLSVDETFFDTASSEVLITVSNIDRTAPTIESVSSNTSEWATQIVISVSATDLQPDLSPGSGLAPEAYSFDGGATWQSDNTFSPTDNGTLSIQVKDNCDNIASTTYEVANLDTSGPTLTYSTTTVWYEGDSPREYTFTATDWGVGLADKPFSYDGGQTWTDESSFSTSDVGEFVVLVKDALGNISEQRIDNKADKRPVIPDILSSNGSEGGDSSPSGISEDESGAAWDSKPDIPTASVTEKTLIVEEASSNLEDTTSDSPFYYSSNNETLNKPNELTLIYEPNEDNIIRYSSQESTEEEMAIAGSTNTASKPVNVSSKKAFYQTTAFKVAAGAGGGTLGIGALAFLAFMFISGGILLSYDSKKYRFLALLPIKHSAKGYMINISKQVMEKSFSNKYKLILGPLFVKKNKNGLINVRAERQCLSFQIDNRLTFELNS